MSRSVHGSRCALALASCWLFVFQVSSVSAAGNGRVTAPRRVAMARQMQPPMPQDQSVFADDNVAPNDMSQHNPPASSGHHGGEYHGSEYPVGGCHDGSCQGGDCYSGDCHGGGCHGGDCCADGCYDGSCCGGSCCGECGGGGCCGGACGSGCCESYDCCSSCMTDCGYRQPRIAVWAEYLYLQATDSDVAYAQQQDGIGGAGTVPFGRIGTVEMDYESGSRIGGSIGCGDCARVMFSWTYLETDDFSSLEAPTIPQGVGAVGSLVQHPGNSITASIGPVDAFHEVDYQAADVLYHRICRCSNNYYLGMLAGAQYGHLEQRFAMTGQFGGGQGGPLATNTEIEFDGGGLKAGFDGEGVLGRGFSTYGRMTGSATAGRFHAHYQTQNTATGGLLALANFSDDRIVPNLEYELGLAWTSATSRLRLSAGYMMSHWMNVITTSEYINAVQDNDYVDFGDTLSFDGFVTRAEVRW